MAKCSRCGLLALWDIRNNEFLEATEYFRANGHLENLPQNEHAYQAKCFVRKANLVLEVAIDPEHIFGYAKIELNAITKDRICNAETPWIQGFHPKEHKEMLVNEQILERQRRHANHSLWIAIVAAIVTAISGLVGAYIARNSAHVGAEATLNAARMQIEAQKEVAKQAQQINITVQNPDTKQPTSKQSTPPRTTHGLKHPQP